MKDIHTQLETSLKALFFNRIAYIRKFKRLWGTTVINGVEVLNPKVSVYPSRTKQVDDLLKFLGIYKNISTANYKGINSYWLYLSPKDVAGNYDTAVMATHMFNDVGKEVLGEIVIGPTAGYHNMGGNKVVAPLPILAGVDNSYTIVNKTALIADIRAKANTLFYSPNASVGTKTPIITHNTKASSVYSQLAVLYSLLTNAPELTITDVTVHDIEVPIQTTTYSTDKMGDIVDSFTTTSYVREKAYDIKVSLAGTTVNNYTTLATKIVADTSSKEPSVVQALLGIRHHGINNPDPNIWYDITSSSTSLSNTYGTVQYALKASVFTNHYMPDKDLQDLLHKAVKTDYEEKSSSNPWASFVAFVLFIVVVVIAMPTGGASLGFIPAISAMAGAVLMGAIAVAVVAYVAASTGNQALASAAGHFLKSVNKLVIIASMVSLFAGGGAIYSSLKSAFTTGGTEAVIDTIKNYIIKFVKSSTKLTLKNFSKAANMMYAEWQKRDRSAILNKLHHAQNDYAKAKAQETQVQTTHPLLESIPTYTSLIAKDNSIYAARYDRPYEWWATNYHTGNIQRTTVDGLWTIRHTNVIM